MQQEDARRDEATVALHGFGLQHDVWGRLVLVTDDGRQYVGVEPGRLFPFSDPDHWIALCDAQGHELVCLESLDALSPETRAVLEEELEQREFLPILARIVKVSSNVEPSQWQVETDRGPTVFDLISEEDVHPLGNHAAVIVDAHSIRYLIPDTRRLDPPSRRILDRYI